MFDGRSIGAGILTIALLTIVCAKAQRALDDTQVKSCPPPAPIITPEIAQAGMRSARDRGFLWHISKGGHSSYLYGTMHIAKQDWIFLGKTVLAALGASDRVALEIDFLDTDIAQRISKASKANGSDTSLPEPLAGRVRAEAERACLPLAVFKSVFPELQIVTLQSWASRHDGMYPDYAIEILLSTIARTLSKPVESLETPELQMQAIRIGNAQERILQAEKVLGLLESNRTRELNLRIGEMWAESRLDELQHILEWCECADTDGERRAWRRLVDDRNQGLAWGIAAIHETGQVVFAAVGSGHMVGASGLPSIFAQRGYQVEFVIFPP